MTLRSRLPLQIYQKYFQVKDTFNSVLDKIEVITDSNAIVYSIRILIVMIALLMGYIHTPKDHEELSTVKHEQTINQPNTIIFENLSQ